jgi:tRNA pseudouridine38-40 synthase
LRNIRCVVSYDGTEYAGFQSQPKKNTIQDQIEKALYQLTSENIKIISSGRTDSGVHAKGQVFNFITTVSIPVAKWRLALNFFLPRDILIVHVEEVTLNFDARKMAKLKIYEYRIRNAPIPDIFQRRYELFHPSFLNLEEMNHALKYLVGEHDFTSFCSIKTVKQSKVRTITKAWMHVNEEANEFGQKNIDLRFYFEGNGFLYNMIRIIVGTLIQIGEGKKNSLDIKHILEAKERKFAGPTADAHALTLISVEYGEQKLSKI